MSIGSNIRGLREQRDMTQLDLARSVVCSIQTVSAWETGKKTPRIGTLSVLAKLFGVPVSSIVDTQGQEPARICLNDDEQAMLELYRRIPAQHRPVVMSMIEAALRSQNLL